MLSKNKIVFLLKDKPKRIQKANSIISRTFGALWVPNYPLSHKSYFAFRLTDKLLRRIKLDKVAGNVQSKKTSSLHILISKCIRFDTHKAFDDFKEKNKSPYLHKGRSATYAKMPDMPKKDNQRYSYKKSRYGEMSKNQLIREGKTIRGSKVRKPKETANKRAWINFLEIFSNKYDKNY